MDLRTTLSKEFYRGSLDSITATLSPLAPGRKHGSSPARILGRTVFASPHNMRNQQAKEIAFKLSNTSIDHVPWFIGAAQPTVFPTSYQDHALQGVTQIFQRFYFLCCTQVLLQERNSDDPPWK